MSVINSGKSRGFVKTTTTPLPLFSMLKNIPPLLTPDALHALASMGHGDDVAIVDANFPAAQVARKSGAVLVPLAGATAPQALAAVLRLLPLDDFVPDAAWTMQVSATPRPSRRLSPNSPPCCTRLANAPPFRWNVLSFTRAPRPPS
jgi:L-fucose mutarotase/ribose pyranase (RbsD/FucU family)